MRALILGGVAWNTMVAVDRFPDPVPQTVFARGLHETVGSSGAGKALNLAVLGVDVTLWAMVGRDAEGDRIRSTMRNAGVDFVGEDDPLGTARHINLMDASGERISIFGNPGSLSFDVDPEPVLSLIGRADLVSVTILDHCRAFLPALAAHRAPVWIDIHDYDGHNPYHREFIEAASHLLMSTVAMDGWRRFAQERVEAGTEVVICTHGAAGASAITATDGWVDVPARRVPLVVDTNGAGDAFFAGFVVAWSAHRDLRAAMEAGADHAARAVASKDIAGPAPSP